ncbi:MAG: hypothetical protein Q9218_004554 [Villophora microphyllina]
MDIIRSRQLSRMCIHHIKHHAPCGHTTQSAKQVVHCYPVAKALEFYHNQPKEFKRGPGKDITGRATTLDPMKHPRLCGAPYLRTLRSITHMGNSRGIKPEGWQPYMTHRARQILETGEDTQSAIMLLEAEFPPLMEQVSEDWIQYLRYSFHNDNLTWHAPSDLQNDHLAGDIVTHTLEMGCGHFLSGNPKCFTNWKNPIGGGPAFCPYKWSQDTGLPIPPRPDHIPGEFLPNDLTEKDSDDHQKTFKRKFLGELLFQAMDQGEEQHAVLISQYHTLMATSGLQIPQSTNFQDINIQEHPAVALRGGSASMSERDPVSSATATAHSEYFSCDSESIRYRQGETRSSTPDFGAHPEENTGFGEDTSEPRWMSGVDWRITIKGAGKAKSVLVSAYELTMARGDEPLLSQGRPSSDHSDERSVEEEDALLTGQKQQRLSGWPKWREIGLFAWAVIATALVILFAVLYQHQRQTSTSQPSGGGGWKNGRPTGKRNLIFMVSDGMGPTSLSLTRTFRQTVTGLPIDDVLVLDGHMIGTSRTRSTSSLITDSAAGATAFSCGKKSYNGAISVLPNRDPCGTVLEAAKKAGYMTGLVVTTRITDATPACFAAHVNHREEEDRIAEQEVGEGPLGRVLDLMLGGGRCHFLPNTTAGSCRGDDKDVVDLAQKNGFSYVSDRKGFDGLNFGSGVKLPLLGLFADTDIPYEVDRRHMDDVYPSLDEMARTALQALQEATQDSEKGFFLMIEGSRIDHAGHGNDPVAQVHEVLAYDKAFASVLEFLDKDGVEGVLVGTSDHETGGLATARQLHDEYPEYHYFPTVLANATRSAENLAYQLRDHIAGKHISPLDTGIKTPPRSPAPVPKAPNEHSSKDLPSTTPSSTHDSDLEHYIRLHILSSGLRISDPSPSELSRLMHVSTDPWPASYILADMISRRAQVGWTTHGHSAVDVNIYASDPEMASPLGGNHENTEIGKYLVDYLDLEDELDVVTEELRAKGMQGWMGRELKDEVIGSQGDHYAGDFRKRSLGCGCESGSMVEGHVH